MSLIKDYKGTVDKIYIVRSGFNLVKVRIRIWFYNIDMQLNYSYDYYIMSSVVLIDIVRIDISIKENSFGINIVNF